MRRSLLLTSAAIALPLGGCGGADVPPPAPVRVHVDTPNDGAAVRSDAVEVRGTVRPASARVLVHGRQAEVSGGAFTVKVDLAAGVNVIDVLAGAGDARPMLTAVRVRRITTVAVPDVLGMSADDATARLRLAGLKADTQTRGGGLFDGLFGGDPAVCETNPVAGSEVTAGTTVEVTLARSC
jgi:hypothetical protein